MTEPTATRRANLLEEGTVSYEHARVVVTPEAPFHYTVKVSEADGTTSVHAVEHLVVNTTTVRIDDPIWFIDVEVDVGVPIGEPGDTAWIWP